MVTCILPMEAQDVVVRRRGKRLVGSISLRIAGQGVTIILGPNGSGKTTLLKVMHGEERISSGRIAWAVPDAVAQHHQGYVFQTPIMLCRSVRDNLRYPLQLRGVRGNEMDRLVAEWANKIGLSQRLTLQATRLSGGEKQKLAIGRALIRRPQVLFLDEPCENLDGASTHEIETLLLEAQSAGIRIIMTTHDLGQARRLATDALFVLHGNVAETGPAHAFFNEPQSEKLKAFFRGDIVT